MSLVPVTRQCIFCRKTKRIHVSRQGLSFWLKGGLDIDLALPFVSEEDRYLLKTQVCSDCRKEMTS